VSTFQASLRELPDPEQASIGGLSRRLDLWMLAGIAIAVVATIAGIASTGVSPTYFFQPTGALIVIGGTLGVTFITTPRVALLRSLRRVGDLFFPTHSSREDLIEEIVSYVRLVRIRGLMAIEPMLGKTSDRFLAESLLLAMDVNQRGELETALANKLRLSERQGEADAKVLEVTCSGNSRPSPRWLMVSARLLFRPSTDWPWPTSYCCRRRIACARALPRRSKFRN
jgi:hypothetical protein